MTAELRGPLVGARVLEIGGGIAASFATRLMAQYGAQVIKVEQPPAGDPLRRAGPYAGETPHPETSLPFLYLNTNKLGVTLDLATARGRSIFLDLIDETDIVVDGSKPGARDEWELGWERLHRTNPALILTSVTPFGGDGPYSGYEATEIVISALGGIMYMSGPYEGPPLLHGHPQAQFMGGLHAAGSSLVAYYHVLRGGPGQYIDVSMQAGVAHELVHNIAYYTYMGATHGRAPREGGSGINGAGNGFGGFVEVADGYLAVDAPPEGRWDEIADLLGVPELKDDRFRTKADRIEHARELDALVLPALRQIDRATFFHHAQSNGWSAGVIQTLDEISVCPQLEARGFWKELDHPVAGTLRYPAEFCRMSDSPGALLEAAPLLGQDNETILGERLGYDHDDLALLRNQGVI